MSDPSHAIQAAIRIVPQYVTGDGNAAERLKEVEAETMRVANIIQEAIDAATADLRRES